MSELDYTYTFSSISERFTRIQMVDHNKSISSGFVEVAVKDFTLFYACGKQISSIVADLIDVACALHVVDCISIRKNDMPCRIHVNLPVRHPEILGKPDIQEKLQTVLDWYTGDQWSITFTPYMKCGRTPELQRFLIEDWGRPTTVALWSGGLDALAGLYHQLLLDKTSHHTLFGAGSNNIVFSTQKKVAGCVGKKFPNRTQLIQLPIRLNQSKNLTKAFNQRARGLVFILLGIACSHQLDQNTLHIYENGVGAINLPFTRSEVGLDHSRSVHPLSLHYVSEFASSILEKPFFVFNPFLFSTKSQMCSLFKESDATPLIFQTITCDRVHRKKVSQCGYCSSCLLRRQALAAQSIEDETRYVSKELLSKRQTLPEDKYYTAMYFQVENLRSVLGQADPWQGMIKNYSYLQETVDRTYSREKITKEIMQNKLLAMYKNYIHEWDIARPIFGPEFQDHGVVV
jgi:7-cyano-7-deazaguanine synthase in queuosine biosynthesis